MGHAIDNAFRRLLVRAAQAAEDGSVASLSTLERLCFMVAEEVDPSLAAEYLWQRKRLGDMLGARNLVITRMLARYEVTLATAVAA